MPRRKDCFGLETYVCQTRNCAYMSDCVRAVWEKKLKRIQARRPGPANAAGSPLLTQTPGGVTLRAKEFAPRSTSS